MFSFSEFSRFLSKIFSDFWPKNFENLSKLPSTCPEEHFVAWFFLSFETFGFSAETFGMVLKILSTCLEYKLQKKQFFLFLSRIFSNFERKFFRLLAKKLQKDFKSTYVSRGIVCGLKFFSNVLNRFGCSAETFGMVLNFLSTCPEKKLRKKQLFLLFFQNFFEFWSKIFQTFGQKTSKSFQNYLRVQRNSLWLEIFF